VGVPKGNPIMILCGAIRLIIMQNSIWDEPSLLSSLNNYTDEVSTNVHHITTYYYHYDVQIKPRISGLSDRVGKSVLCGFNSQQIKSSHTD
jgi:hypothetical protein